MYFDYAATTPVLPEVIEVINATLSNNFGNASSSHYQGRKASSRLEKSRETIAAILEVDANEIVFTSCATESNNMALIGTALSNQHNGKHIITTSVEHHSVLHPVKYLEEKFGFEITYLPVDENGMFSLEMLKSAIRSDTILVSIMMVNNEIGNIYPIAEIGKILHKNNIIFHTDAVQAVGKMAVLPQELNVDLLSATAHKFGGPKGVGFLYIKSKTSIDSFLHGGDQELKRRAGTENLPYIAGMSTALAISNSSYLAEHRRYKKFKERILKKLAEANIDFYINGASLAVPYVLNLGFLNIKQDLLMMKLDLKQIAVSTGSACTAGAIEPSHVLAAMYGNSSKKLSENIRISFGKETSSDEVDALIAELIKIMK